MKHLFAASASAVALAASLTAAQPAHAQDGQAWNPFANLFSAQPDSTTVKKGTGATPYKGKLDVASVRADLAAKGFILGSPIFVRIFKQERVLELWMQDGDGTFKKVRDFSIKAVSGDLGPKRKQGDMQAPEGFYTVSAGQMNPGSDYQYSFNLGYPNAFDRAYGGTGSALMVHGADNTDGLFKSVGCYAIKDVHYLYVIADAALKAGQGNFPVHAFPFRMTSWNMSMHAGSAHMKFWRMLAPAYTNFEQTRRVPAMTVVGRQYVMRGTEAPIQVADNGEERPAAKRKTGPKAETVAELPAPSALGVKEQPAPVAERNWYAFSTAPLRYSATFDGKPVRPFTALPGSVVQQTISADFSACAINVMFSPDAPNTQAACAQAVADKFVHPVTGEIRQFKQGKGDSLAGWVPMSNTGAMMSVMAMQLLTDETPPTRFVATMPKSGL